METKEYLIQLAEKYETKDFCKEDPSQFLYWYSKEDMIDVEIASFIAAMLSFGNRKQFIPKIKYILELADKKSKSISSWILNSFPDFPSGKEKFYRFYSYDDLCTLFRELRVLIEKNGSLGNALKKNLADEKHPSLILSSFFPESKIVPKGKSSANKRIHMFLRWMVRRNSPVDIGIWDFILPSSLIIPLDTHVIQEAKKLKLIADNAGSSLITAKNLTEQAKKIWPDDPVKLDFALFGLGIDEK